MGSVAKYEQLFAKWIKLKTAFYDGCQAVDAFSHVGVPTGQINRLVIEMDHKALRARQICASSAMSALSATVI